MSRGRALLALLCLLTTAGAGAVPTVELRVDTRQVKVGESFAATVTLTSRGVEQLAPRLAVGEAFEIVRKLPNSGLDLHRNQARMRSTWMLRARRTGMFALGPATVVIGGVTYQSDTVTMTVLEAAAAAAATPASREKRRGKAEQEPLVLAEPSGTEVYVGEQLTVSVRLLTRVRVSNVRSVSQPNLAGFWLEEIPVPEKPPREKEQRGGVRYDSYTLRKLALFPTTSGELTIGPFGWELTMVTTDFFFPERRLSQVETSPSTIRVRPLPEKGKPPGFGGAVGHFELSATLDRQRGNTEDAFVLSVRVSGWGNIKTLPEPVLPELTGFKHYASTSQEQPAQDGNWLGGTKTWEYVLLPRAPGEHEIPAIELPVFDPTEGRYTLLATQPLVATVVRGSGPRPVAAGGDGADHKSQVRALARDVNYIKLEPGAPPMAAIWLRQRALVAAVVALPLLANAIALAVVWGRRRSARDPVGRRKRAALKLARQRLKPAGKKPPPSEVAAGVSAAVLGYLGDHFDEPPNGLTRERIKALLAEAGCEAKVGERVVRLLDRCDTVRFAHVGTDTRELGDGLRREAEALLKRLESRLRRAA